MANLIECPACGNDVSTNANSCPNCGEPIGDTTTIEKTGKKWKLMKLSGGLIAVLGIILAVLPGETATGLGSLALFVGFSLFVTARLGAWWYHG